MFLIMTVDKNGRKKIEKLDQHSVPEKIFIFWHFSNYDCVVLHM